MRNYEGSWSIHEENKANERRTFTAIFYIYQKYSYFIFLFLSGYIICVKLPIFVYLLTVFFVYLLTVFSASVQLITFQFYYIFSANQSPSSAFKLFLVFETNFFTCHDTNSRLGRQNAIIQHQCTDFKWLIENIP